MSTQNQPILDIAKSFLKPELKEDNEENMGIIIKYIEEYIDSKITKEQLIGFVSSYVNSIEPIEKVDAIYKTFKPGNISPVTDQRLMGIRQKSRPWTAEEDERLKQGVTENGPNNWGVVATFVGGGRSRAQCSQRWNRVIDPKISKANWTAEEEEKLLNAVEAFGQKAWTRVASEFGNRSDVQCRFKYNFIMKKKKYSSNHYEVLNHEEDESKTLINHYE